MTGTRTTTTLTRRSVAAAPVQGTLALDPAHLAGPAPDETPERVLTSVPTTAPHRPVPHPDADVVPFDRARRREVEAWAPRYVQAAVEVAGGHRPAVQLLRWSTPEVHRDLARRAVLVARARVHDVPETTAQPGGRRRTTTTAEPARVISTRACAVTPTAVEVSAHVRHGRRSRAVAARFEHLDGRWQCTALELA